VIRIAKEGHPEIVVGHDGDSVRITLENHAVRLESIRGGLNIVHTVTNDGMVGFVPAIRSEHEPRPSAIKERDVGSLNQEWEPQDVTVENYGPSHIAHRDSNLSDGGKTECHLGPQRSRTQNPAGGSILHEQDQLQVFAPPVRP
jgi:hypothetical protein